MSLKATLAAKKAWKTRRALALKRSEAARKANANRDGRAAALKAWQTRRANER